MKNNDRSSSESNNETDLTVYQLAMKCDLLQTKVDLAAFGIDEAVKEFDEAAVRAEIEDLSRFETKYYEYYENLTGLCKFTNIANRQLPRKEKIVCNLSRKCKEKSLQNTIQLANEFADQN